MRRSPFHPGELAAQALAGGGSNGAAIRDFMPEQHRTFFAALPFVAVAARNDGWPVATILEGAPGFVAAPDNRTLRIAALPAATDPAGAGFREGEPLGLLGIDLATRRRNRANGVIAGIDEAGLSLAVRQSFGNCPQYIHLRDVSRAAGAPAAAEAERLLGLDGAARLAIAAADTFFVASNALDVGGAGGMDISHRGGWPGFVRVDGDTLSIPDFAGNRYFNTLGNLVAEPRAALLFVDFARGDLLHVQGTVEIIWEGAEVDAVPDAERLWRVHVRRAWRRPAALSLRWAPLQG